MALEVAGFETRRSPVMTHVKFYMCQFAKCLYFYRTPQELNQHYVEEHKAVLPPTGASDEDATP